MDGKELKVAVVGLTPLSQKYLSAVYESTLFELTSVADRDVELAERVSTRYQCKFYDDFRQLIIQNQHDLIIDGTSGFAFNEHVITALEKGSNILKINFPGPTFEDLAEIVKAARKNKTRFLTSESLSFAPGLCNLRKYLTSEENQEDSFKLSTTILAPIDLNEPTNRWLADPELAGGGVLLQNGFAPIKEIIRLFGLPQQVYGLTTSTAPDKKQRMSLTEDAALLTMKYPEKLIATVQAGRVFGPANEEMKIFRSKECLSVTRNSFVITDISGNIIQEISGMIPEEDLIMSILENTADKITKGDSPIEYEDEILNLKTMALIQAAYLSAKTMMPETPEKIITLSGLDPDSL